MVKLALASRVMCHGRLFPPLTACFSQRHHYTIGNCHLLRQYLFDLEGMIMLVPDMEKYADYVAMAGQPFSRVFISYTLRL